MTKANQLVGKKFNKLLVIKRAENNSKGNAQWLCKCDCGNTIITVGYRLKNGHTKSCGCLNVSHKLSKNPLYKVLYRMYESCCNIKYDGYKNYGARGINIYDEWNKDIVGMDSAIKNFTQWTEKHEYKKGLSIDRINNNGDYKPSNCRWTDRKTQCNNKRNNHIVIFNGQKLTVTQIARKYNVNKRSLLYRIDKGIETKKAIDELQYKHKVFKDRQ